MSDDASAVRAWREVVGRHIGLIQRAEEEYAYVGYASNASVVRPMYERIRAGDELRAWSDLKHSYGALKAHEEAAVAVWELARRDLEWLLSAIDSTDDPNVMVLLSPHLHSPEEFALGLAWLRAPCSRRLAALGLSRCLEWATGRAWSSSTADQIVDSRECLAAIGDALACRSGPDELNLWWQMLAITSRFSALDRGSPSARLLADVYGEAAARLSRHFSAEFMSSTDVISTYRSWNPAIGAVLPFIASRIPRAIGERVLAEFFRDVERRLYGERHDVPTAERDLDLLYLEAGGAAILLEAEWGLEPSWWRNELLKLRGGPSPWTHDGSAVGHERSAWVLAAACFACLMSKDNESVWRPLMDEILRLVDAMFANLVWELGWPSSVRKVLPALLAQVCVLLPPEIGGQRVLDMATDVRSSKTLSSMQAAARAVLSSAQNQKLLEMIEERSSYERELDGA